MTATGSARPSPRGTIPCIPSKSNRKVPIPHDAILYRQRHLIENMFGKLKDWRRIHTRYDRCAHTFLSAIAIAIAATVIFWLWPTMSPEPRRRSSMRYGFERKDAIALGV
jgi:hypothetical protein